MRRFALFIKNNRKGMLIIFGFVILLIALSIDLKRSPPIPSVQSFYPPNGATEIAIQADLEITFDKPLTEAEKQYLFFRITPGVPLVKSWADNKTVKLLPQTTLSPSTDYNFTVTFKEEQIYSSMFSTRYIRAYSDEEIEKMQGFAEVISEGFYNLVEKYPFAPEMPLKNDQYYVVYDYDLDQFRVRLQLLQNAPDEVKEVYLNNALDEIKLYVPDLTEDNYYVLYLD